MPPKQAAKLTPEQMRAQYEDWMKTEEYQIWEQLLEMKNDLKIKYGEITETVIDITGDYQPFFDKIFEFMKVWKTKAPKIKEIKHEFIRTLFFGKQVLIIDGLDVGTGTQHKDSFDSADGCKHKFLAIYKSLDDVHDSIWNEENYQEMRKKMQKNYQDFFAGQGHNLTGHLTKKHHQFIMELIYKSLQRLKTAMESCMRLSIFDYQCADEKERTINDFKEKALIEKFCCDLQVCWNILQQTGALKDNPDLYILTNKFKISRWKENQIQRFFILPLQAAWNNLRNNFVKLFSKGEDYWKVTMKENEELLKDSLELIQRELIAERILGNQLKRDQLDFIYNVLQYIYKSPAKDKLLHKESGIVEFTIPRLLILRYLENMLRIKEEKKEYLTKQQAKSEGENPNMQNSNKLDDLKFGNSSKMNDSRKEEVKVDPRYMSISLNKNSIKLMSSTTKNDEDAEDSEENQKLFGRYWIWKDYMPPNSQEEILDAIEGIRHINLSVRQDIADHFISEGMRPRHKAGAKDPKMAEYLAFKKKLEEEDKANVRVNMIRAPIVWNHPDIQNDHQYRSIAEPTKAYVDGRVDQMLNVIDALAYMISTHVKERWQELVDRVIDCYIFYDKQNASSNKQGGHGPINPHK